MIIIEEEKNNNNNNKVSGVIIAFFSPILKILLIGMLIVVLLASAHFYKKEKDATKSKGDKSNTGNVVEEKAFSNTNIENITPTPEGWSLDINLDTTVDEIITELEKNNGCINDYIKEEDVKEYLTAFINAELITQYPDLRSDPNKIGTPTAEGEFQGCIQIHRAASDTTDGKTQILTYIDSGTFETYISNNNSQILNHFTLGSDGSLIVAGWERKTTNVTSNVPGVENIVDKVEYTLSKNSINYKSLVEIYTMPFDLLWALTVMGEDAEFAYNVAQLALNSKIIFTVQDNLTTTITTNTEEYDEQKKVEKQARLDVIYKDKAYSKIATREEEKEPVPYKTETIIKTEECSNNINITYADTWIVEYINSYSNSIIPDTPTDSEPRELEDTKYDIIATKELETDEEMDEELLKFEVELCSSVKNHAKEVKDGNIKGNIGTIYQKEYTRKINQTISNKTEMTYNLYVQGTANVPKEKEDFVKLFQDSDKAKVNIRTASDLLFKVLEKSEKTADMIDLVKYLIYKNTDQAIEYDFGIFKQSGFKISGTATIGLAGYLRQFSHAGDAPQTEDKKYYLMYGDGSGWPTIGTADLQWKSHHSKFSEPGKITHNGQEKEVGNVAEYINSCLKNGPEATYSKEEVANMQIGIEKTMVDTVGNSVQRVYFEYVQEATEGITLSRQQLYSLTAIAYNFGYLPVRNDKTFKQTYEEGLVEFEENSWEHNRYIWDNWWCRVGGGKPGHLICRDAAYETYIKGVFDFSQSEVGEVFDRKYMIYYTQEQWNSYDYAPNKKISRTTANEEERFTMVVASGTVEYDSSDPKVIGYYTSTTGKKFTILNQSRINGWGDKCNRAAAAIISSGYSGQTAQELINKINESKIKDEWNSVPSNEYFNLYGLKLDKDVSGELSVSEYTPIIRNQLNLGGYVMVWLAKEVDVSKDLYAPYYGKSTEQWTGKFHWVAIVDYRIENGVEEIMVLDYRGGDWYSIDEFQHGIDRYALISEQ